jgi:uncharacterized membrane protein (DUF106 family)
MEPFLDALWRHIVVSVHFAGELMDVAVSPLNNALGPAWAIAAIAVVTVALAKFLTKNFKTKRYSELEKRFKYWFDLRQEALKCDSSEKGKELAKNIDQAELNRAYYDYFFEGFLNNLMTMYLPILLALGYVNEAYKPAELIRLTGRDYVFKLGGFGGEAMLVGSVFWFVLAVVLTYIVWPLAGKLCSRLLSPKGAVWKAPSGHSSPRPSAD